MKLVNPEEFAIVPWKNGLGTTKQIAVSKDTSAYWRMSIADVVENSEFSLFPERHRVLTVIEGDGMDLLSEDKTLEADLEKPVSFPGDIQIRSQLRAGPIRDFNLIYDANSLNAEVTVVRNTIELELERALVSAVYILDGEVASAENQPVNIGALLLASEETIQLSLSKTAKVLVIKLNSVTPSHTL